MVDPSLQMRRLDDQMEAAPVTVADPIFHEHREGSRGAGQPAVEEFSKESQSNRDVGELNMAPVVAPASSTARRLAARSTRAGQMQVPTSSATARRLKGRSI